MLVSLQPPAGNTRGPVHVEMLLQTLHRAATRRQSMTLKLQSRAAGVGYAARIPDGLRTLFLQEMQDAYPGMVVDSLDCAVSLTAGSRRSHYLYWLPENSSLATYETFLDVAQQRSFADPVAGLLAAIRTGTSGKFQCDVEVKIRVAQRSRVRQLRRTEKRMAAGFKYERIRRLFQLLATNHRWAYRLAGRLLGHLSRTAPQNAAIASEKPFQPLFECWIQVVAVGPTDASSILENKVNETAGAYGRFQSNEGKFLSSATPFSRGFLLSAKEVASLWHPLTESGDSVARVDRPSFREVEPPPAFSQTSTGALLGRIKYRNARGQVRIDIDDLRRHFLVAGKTGCGKSTFLLNLVRQQIEQNRGVILLDPHGELAQDVLARIPSRRTNEIIVMDAADRVAPVRFNPLAGPAGADASLIADGVLTSFKHVFGFDEGSAPRLLHIFRNCLLTIIGTPHASMAGVQRLLVDAPFRASVAAAASNVAVRDFWLNEFGRWNDRDRTQYIASLQNKLGAFITNEQLQRILGGGPRSIDLRRIMDGSQVLICDLSKGAVGHDASKLLGSLLLSSLHLAVMSRSDTAQNDRPDCIIAIDEFPSYLSEGNTTMSEALAESRKYRASYVLSTQLLEQLDHKTLAGLLGNCGSTLCMTIGPRDAEIMSELLGSGLQPADLMQIPKYHGYLRTLVNGAPHTASIQTLPPTVPDSQRAETIRKVSKQRFGLPKPAPDNRC